MAIRSRQYIIDKNSSQKVFQLRKSGQMLEAHNLAIKLYNQNPEDEWIQKAYAWVLIDIIKNEIKSNSGKASDLFNQLLSIDINTDEIITKQINFLRPKLEDNYKDVQQAENLSKNGDHTQAIDLFRKLQNEGKLSQTHHESFGWAIYRYINSNKDNLQINIIKKLLIEYLELHTPKPSILHSVLLKFSISYAQKHQQFNLFKFFKLWNPEYLRDEDKEQESNEGKIYPSLVERLLRQLINDSNQIDIEYLQRAIGDKSLVIDSIREAYFWKIFNLHKENNLANLWLMFDHYISKYSNYGASHWHSEILKIADRFMTDRDAWRFYDFFHKWNIENFQDNDWHEETIDGYKSKPLVKKALKKVFEFSKLPGNKNKGFSWIIPLYKKALTSFDNDIWLLREYATILNISGETQEAICIYKSILLDLNDQAYVWHEFAELLADSNSEIAISMLCKSISIQKNEDFLGDIHLLLAKLLIDVNKLKEAKNELNTYREHRIEKGWKTAEVYESLESHLHEINVTGDNSGFYENNIDLTVEYIYSDIPWQDFLLYDKWKNKKQQEISSFTDLNSIEFIVKTNKFDILGNSIVNAVIQFKTHYDKTNNRYIALQAQKSTCTFADLTDKASSALAIIDHVNEQKKLFHYVIDSTLDGIIRFSQTELRPNIGEFLEIKYFTSYNKQKCERKLHILDVNSTDMEDQSLIKTVSGELSLKYKDNGRTIDYQDIIDDEIGIDIKKPDFAFIDDYYVPKYLLRKQHISSDCDVSVKVLFNGEKWSVFELTKQ